MKIDETMQGLREQVFKNKSKNFMAEGDFPEYKSWGLVMETAYDDMVATLVVLIDGTCSLYLSSGGGIIGAGEHEDVANYACILADSFGLFFLPYTDPDPVTEFPYPKPGNTHFYFLCDQEIIKTPEIEENTLGEDEHPLSPLFHSLHNLMAMMRDKTPEVAAG
jgi:hypothetical protein